jgi:protein TonB
MFMKSSQSPVLRSFVLHAAFLVGGVFSFSTTHPTHEIEMSLTLPVQGRKNLVLAKPKPKTNLVKTVDPASEVVVPLNSERSEAENSNQLDAMADAKGTYLSELRAWIDRHKFYPESARLLGQTGVVEVKFKIDPSGKILSFTIDKPCAHTRLNQAAINLMKSLDRFKPAPAGILAGIEELILPIEYRI